MKTWFENHNLCENSLFKKDLIRNKLEPKIGKCIVIERG